MAQSLYNICKRVARNQESGEFKIGGYSIFVEYYNQADISMENPIGEDTDESRITLVTSETLTIPKGYVLTPQHPRKSLVLMCNNLVNNGTISMQAKAPYVLPHDYFLLGFNDGWEEDIIVPAYADNSVPITFLASDMNASNGIAGTDGTNRNCGSGGTGGVYRPIYHGGSSYSGKTGSGYAFGGGAGGAGVIRNASAVITGTSVDEKYPMIGATDTRTGNTGSTIDRVGYCRGGTGNPAGQGSNGSGNLGCGGRIIIFCNHFTNNGIITSKGVSGVAGGGYTSGGGASGGGAIDLFYSDLRDGEGTIDTSGGDAVTLGAKGGAGCLTYTYLGWGDILKPQKKKYSRDNWVELFSQYLERYSESV